MATAKRTTWHVHEIYTPDDVRADRTRTESKFTSTALPGSLELLRDAVRQFGTEEILDEAGDDHDLASVTWERDDGGMECEVFANDGAYRWIITPIESADDDRPITQRELFQ